MTWGAAQRDLQGDGHLLHVHPPLREVGREEVGRVLRHVAGVAHQVERAHVRALPGGCQKDQEHSPGDLPDQAALRRRGGRMRRAGNKNRRLHEEAREVSTLSSAFVSFNYERPRDFSQRHRPPVRPIARGPRTLHIFEDVLMVST